MTNTVQQASARCRRLPACESPASRWRRLPACESAPRAFTLVELLVVIGIIGLLAAIVTPVVMRSLTKARNAAIKAEIDLLHTAVMNYKSEYGSFPPCFDDFSGTLPAAKHISRIFPRCSTAPAQLATALTGKTPPSITPGNALAFWLSGYTSDPTLPLTNGTRNKLFDFDTSRLNTTTGLYWPSGKSSSPYVYIDKTQFGTIVSGTSNNPVTVGSNTYRAEPNSASSFFNADSFQILCAGRDEEWNTADDLSNFWPGTRQEYADSLK